MQHELISLAFPQNQKVECSLLSPPSMMNGIIGQVSSVPPGFILITSSGWGLVIRARVMAVMWIPFKAFE